MEIKEFIEKFAENFEDVTVDDIYYIKESGGSETTHSLTLLSVACEYVFRQFTT